MLEWIEKFVIIYLFLASFIYLVPSEKYRKYIRFFTEMILIITLLLPVLEYLDGRKLAEYEDTYRSFTEEKEQREQEAQEYQYLDKDYMNYVFGEADEY